MFIRQIVQRLDVLASMKGASSDVAGIRIDLSIKWAVLFTGAEFLCHYCKCPQVTNATLDFSEFQLGPQGCRSAADDRLAAELPGRRAIRIVLTSGIRGGKSATSRTRSGRDAALSPRNTHCAAAMRGSGHLPRSNSPDAVQGGQAMSSATQQLKAAH